MHSAEVLVEAFSRVREEVHDAVAGLSAEQLAARLDPETNSVAWLIWHLTRVQDDHVSEVADTEQVWIAQDWAGRFGLPFHPEDTGYGHQPDDVAKVQVTSGALLTGYYDAVHTQTIGFVASLTDTALDEIIDDSWVPPVTLGVRLISVIADDLQHTGQAALINGILHRAE